MAAKLRQFTVGQIGKGQFLRNWRNLAEEGDVRKISSPGSLTGMPYLGIAVWKHRQRGNVAPVWRVSLPVHYRKVQHIEKRDLSDSLIVECVSSEELFISWKPKATCHICFTQFFEEHNTNTIEKIWSYVLNNCLYPSLQRNSEWRLVYEIFDSLISILTCFRCN